MGKFHCVNQTARQLVVGVGREPVAGKELCLGIECLGVSLHQAVDLEASWLGTCNCISTCKTREVLPERMTSNESMEVIPFQAEPGQIVPSSHVLPRCR